MADEVKLNKQGKRLAGFIEKTIRALPGRNTHSSHIAASHAATATRVNGNMRQVSLMDSIDYLHDESSAVTAEIALLVEELIAVQEALFTIEDHMDKAKIIRCPDCIGERHKSPSYGKDYCHRTAGGKKDSEHYEWYDCGTCGGMGVVFQ